ncbi:MAG: class I SAM-dependent methyltransferase [Caldilineaceae bacterium]
MTTSSLDNAQSTTSSTGHALAEANWLDIHFEVARVEYEAMLRDVGLQPGWHVLDAGCGGGSFLPLMSELVGPAGKITALDLAPENVAIVEQRAAANHFCCAVQAQQGSVTQLPFADNSLDAVWCANVVQYLTKAEFHQMAAEFFRVLHPGGILAIKEFDQTAMQLGPLDPEVIWHWNQARRKYEQFLGGNHTLNFRKWLGEAGFTIGSHKTYIGEDQHPLSEKQRRLLRGALRLFAGFAEKLPDLSPAEKEIWRQRIADIDNPDHIIHEPDFYFRRAYVLIRTNVPE